MILFSREICLLERKALSLMLEGTIVVTVLVLELSLPWIQATCCVIDKA